MKLTTEIDKKNNLRIHTVDGPLDFKALQRILKETYSSQDYNSDMSVLWDIRKSDLSSFTSAQIQEIKNLVKKQWGTGGMSRAAIVVSRDIDYGLTRMYELISSEETKSEIRVFREYPEAVQWLK